MKTKRHIKAAHHLRLRVIVAICLFLPIHAFAQAGFSGPRADDQPIFEGSLAHIQEKNDHAGIESLSNLNIGPEETVVRIYEGFGQQAYRRGGHPLTLFEFHQKRQAVRAVLYPPCPRGSEELPDGPHHVTKMNLSEREEYRQFLDGPVP